LGCAAFRADRLNLAAEIPPRTFAEYIRCRAHYVQRGWPPPEEGIPLKKAGLPFKRIGNNSNDINQKINTPSPLFPMRTQHAKIQALF